LKFRFKLKSKFKCIIRFQSKSKSKLKWASRNEDGYQENSDAIKKKYNTRESCCKNSISGAKLKVGSIVANFACEWAYGIAT